MCTFIASRKASMALKLMLYAPRYFASDVWLFFFFFIRQQVCFFLNSEQNSVLKCDPLFDLVLLRIYGYEMCLYVIYKVWKEE